MLRFFLSLTFIGNVAVIISVFSLPVVLFLPCYHAQKMKKGITARELHLCWHALTASLFLPTNSYTYAVNIDVSVCIFLS